MLRNVSQLKTLNCLFIGAYHDLQQEPEPCKKFLGVGAEAIFKYHWSWFKNLLNRRPAKSAGRLPNPGYRETSKLKCPLEVNDHLFSKYNQKPMPK